VVLLGGSLVRGRQAPLRARYRRDPEQATIAVEVTGTLDVRGTLGLDPAVPVGFQRMTCTTRATVPAGTDPRLLARLEAEARRSCVNLDTLRRGVPVAASTQFDSGPQEGARIPPPT
jgi:hypothetical protein